ncbi:hypothetical protein D5S18_28810 [Nocardia panacis]|uniref:Uncharacterized protein n=1 Tax=Nocardia panacis TaxID=2340916 RepID=A0A3A4KC58_9NOCA|nr:hypothetical protein [Nocardia panacis]RJO69892.1 hypothetical protein D5S18_28810 [Nocardia panacis]
MHSIAGWWDGFELWVAGLPFIPQFLVVLLGMVPVSFAIAFALDRGLRAGLRLLGRDRIAARREHPAEPEITVPSSPAELMDHAAHRTVVQSGAR